MIPGEPVFLEEWGHFLELAFVGVCDVCGEEVCAE